MELSYFLAKFFGIYFLIFSLLWLFRQEQIKNLIKELITKPPVLALSGMFSLMLGVAIAVSHSIWLWNWQGLITLLAYLAIIKGVLRIGFPKQSKDLILSSLKGSGYWLMFLIMLVIGLYLSYTGFHLNL
jgi:uncharacterized protein YjeT (DUF2065 family)